MSSSKAKSGAKTRKKSVKLASEKSIVLLGAAGVIGRRTLQFLEMSQDYPRVVVVDHKKPDQTLRKAKFYKLDLTTPTADTELAEILTNENCDTLIYTALPASPLKNFDYAHELVAIGSYYTFNACHAARVRKVVMSTTTDVYGAFPTNPNYLTEDMPLKGHLQDKMLADRIDAEKQAKLFQKKNPDSVVTIFRHCTILGPDVDTYKTRYLKRPVVLTILGYDPLVQFVHVDDAMAAFLKLITADHRGVYNFTGDGVLPLSRVIQMSGAQRLPVTIGLFKTLVQFLWNVDISPAPASWANFLRYLCVVDNHKFKKEVGFAPKMTTQEALQDFVKNNRVSAYV